MAARLWFFLPLAMTTAASVAACTVGDVAAPGPKVLTDTPTESAPAAAPKGPTFHKDVEPIVQNHCQKCHQPGGLAPFSLLTYADAAPMAPAMVAETAARRMPPWGAQDSPDCKPRLPWDHDERLTETELATISAWSSAGAPEGDPKDAPPKTALTAIELANPTLTVQPKTPFVASGTTDQFRCFVLDAPALDAGAYIGGIHVVPGNRKVVHHAVVTTDPKGKLAALAGPDGSFECANVAMADDAADGGGRVTLDVWVPGANPIDLPPNIAMPLVAGAKLIMQIHYSPGGETALPDTTKVQLRIATTKPEYLLFTTAIGNFPGPIGTEGLLAGPADPPSGPEFRVPANARAHVESMQITIPPAADPTQPENPIWIYGVMAHQHLAGVDVKVDLERGADQQCLLQDKWDFHWQRMYTYAAPVERLPTLKPGDTIKLRCTYDNSMFNRRLSAEYRARDLVPMDIRLGEQTLDEMCLVIPQLLVRHP